MSATKSKESNIRGFKKCFTNNSSFKIINLNEMIVINLPVVGAKLCNGEKVSSIGRILGTCQA